MAPAGCLLPGCSTGNLGGKASRWFVAPGGLSGFPASSHLPSSPSDSVAAKRPSVERLSKHTYTANPVISKVVIAVYVGERASSAPRHQEVTPAVEEATPLIGITAICPRVPAGQQAFHRPCSSSWQPLRKGSLELCFTDEEQGSVRLRNIQYSPLTNRW